MNLIVQDYKSAQYTPRTYYNARVANLTVAFAVNFNTAGEKCTHNAASTTSYLAIPLAMEKIEAARSLYRKVKDIPDCKTLNIAGNGIYTLVKARWTQEDVNQYVYDVLKQVHIHHCFEKIVSGGQTGVDIAGIVAAVAIGIPAIATLPKGFIQRHEDGVDKQYSEEIVREQILNFVGRLNKW